MSRPGEVGGAPPARLAGATVTHFPPLSNSQCTRSPTVHPRRPIRGAFAVAFAGLSQVGRGGATTAREPGRLRAARADARGLAASGPVPPVGVHRSQALAPRGTVGARVPRHADPTSGPRGARRPPRRGRRRLRLEEGDVRGSGGRRPRTRARVRGGDDPSAGRDARRRAGRRPQGARHRRPRRRGCRSCSAGRAARATSRPWIGDRVGAFSLAGSTGDGAYVAATSDVDAARDWVAGQGGRTQRYEDVDIRIGAGGTAYAVVEDRVVVGHARPPCARRSTPPGATTSPR